MKEQFNVYVQNLGKYNEGYLVGDWIGLPQSEEVLDDFLKDRVCINENYEEYEIADIDNFPFDNDVYEMIQWGGLHKANNIAVLYSQLTDFQKEALDVFICNYGSLSYTELCNAIIKIDDIPYYSYEFEGMQYIDNEYEKLGRTFAETNGITSKLRELNIEYCFDYEKYGKDYSYDYGVGKNGYLSNNYSIDLEFYSEEEINDEVRDILQQYENQDLVFQQSL